MRANLRTLIQNRRRRSASLMGLERRLRITARLEHVEHPVGDHETADDVQRGEDDGQEPEGLLGGSVGLAQE